MCEPPIDEQISVWQAALDALMEGDGWTSDNPLIYDPTHGDGDLGEGSGPQIVCCVCGREPPLARLSPPLCPEHARAMLDAITNARHHAVVRPDKATSKACWHAGIDAALTSPDETSPR